MTAIVTVDRYRAITGDDATLSATVSAKIEDAVDRLEDVLGRPIGSAERTESMLPTRDGMLWPKATPVTVCTAYDIVDGIGLRGVFGPVWPDDDGFVDVTYTGGWVERTANPTATNRLPACIEEDLAFVAYRMINPPGALLAEIPAGATSVSLGDARVTFGPEGARLNRSGVRWSPATLRYRHRVTRGA